MPEATVPQNKEMNMRPTLLVLVVLALLLALLAPAPPAAADIVILTKEIPVFEKLTVADASTPITASTLSPSGKSPRKTCMLTLETAEIRWRVDGAAPDATTGHIMAVGGVLTITGANSLSRFRAIRTTGSSGVLSITCW